jgi:homospermidine synthase
MPRKIILLGCGAVGKCVLHYMPRFLHTKYENVYIVDKLISEKDFPTVQIALKKGSHYIQYTLTSRNIDRLFKEIINTSPGDVVIDLTTRTDCYAIFKATRKHQLHYFNTSTEEANDPTKVPPKCTSPVDHTIWLQHMMLYDVEHKTKHYNAPTSIMEFGMNPGLISIFVKQGILDIAKYVMANKKHMSGEEHKELEKMIRTRDYRGIARKFLIRTVHCSEIDTQKPQAPIPPNRFVNTWSCLGLIDEAFEPAEISMGTHEKRVPFKKSSLHEVVDNLVAIDKPSHSIKFHSYVPKQLKEDGEVEFTEITGVCIHHSENISLNRYLATDDWAPTVHYVYKFSPHTERMFKELSHKQLMDLTKDPRQWKVMNMYDDKLEGYDNVGACFLLEKNPVTGEEKPWAYWTGSILHTDYTQKVLKDPYFGPTVIQVMAGILSAVSYAIRYPNKGMIFSEDVSEAYILKRAKKYLGKFYSGPVSGCDIRGVSLRDLFVEIRQ